MMGNMMGYGFNGYSGFGFGMGFLWQIIWLALIIAVIYFILNSLAQSKDSKKNGRDESIQILNERLARGEISLQEYQKLKETLED